MANPAILVVIVSSLIVMSDQRPTILHDGETVLLEGSRAARSIDSEETSTTLASVVDTTAPAVLLKGSRVIRNVDNEDIPALLATDEKTTTKVSSTEATIRSTESSSRISSVSDETTVNSADDNSSATPKEGLDFLGIFLKAVLRSPDEIIAKRSVEATYGDVEKNEADLDTAANTVFRPLFAYRQQNAQRRRLRTLNVF